MRKAMTTLSVLLLAISMAFGAVEQATVTLNASVGETTANSGIRVADGDLANSFSTVLGYDSLFASAADDITLSPNVDVSVDDAEGYFTVFVKRLKKVPMLVTVSATTMRMLGDQPHYLGYTISGATIVLTTVGTVSTAPTAKAYKAKNYLGGGLRDARTFKYEIPAEPSAPIGAYRAVISFEITMP